MAKNLTISRLFSCIKNYFPLESLATLFGFQEPKKIGAFGRFLSGLKKKKSSKPLSFFEDEVSEIKFGELPSNPYRKLCSKFFLFF